MNFLRGSTLSPIRSEKVCSSPLAAASSIETCWSVLVSGSIVVSRSCSAFISPSPLKRDSVTPWRARSRISRRSSVKLGLGVPLAEIDRERRVAHHIDDLGVRVDELLVGLRLEQLLGQLVVAGETAPAMSSFTSRPVVFCSSSLVSYGVSFGSLALNSFAAAAMVLAPEPTSWASEMKSIVS